MRYEVRKYTHNEGRNCIKMQMRVLFHNNQSNRASGCRNETLSQKQDEVADTVQNCQIQRITDQSIKCLEQNKKTESQRDY